MARDIDHALTIADPFARRLVIQYLDRRENDLRTLRADHADGDYKSIERKGHNLYGSGSAYGLDRISELGSELELAAKKCNGQYIEELIDTLKTFIRNVRVI